MTRRPRILVLEIDLRHFTLRVFALLAAVVIANIGAVATVQAQGSPVDSITVKWRDDVLAPGAGDIPDALRGALAGALHTDVVVVGRNRDGAFRVRLGSPQSIDDARAAINRVRMSLPVAYVNLIPAALDAQSAAALAAASIAQQPLVTRLMVKYRDAARTRASALNGALGDADLDTLSVLAGQPVANARAMAGGAFVVRLFQALPPAQAQALAASLEADPAIEYADVDWHAAVSITPNDPLYASNQWDLKTPGSPDNEPGGVNMPPAWALNTGSASVVVAVIDTGILPHPDLAGRYLTGYDMIVDSIVANDSNGRDADPTDPGDWVSQADIDTFPAEFNGCPISSSSWHGTHVAGTIGAIANNSAGIAGINWVSKILPVRVLGKCGGSYTDIIDAISWAAGLHVPGVPDNANPARVMNISIGGNTPCPSGLQLAITNAINAGSVIAVAAGNSGADASTSAPGNCSGVITVAATGRLGQRASYTNFGPLVEIAAPGGSDGWSILSTLNTGTTVPAAYTYTAYQGTSMATPHVAGIASLILSAKPSLTPAQVLATIQTTARAFPTGTGRDCTTALCGAGIINAAAALASITSSTPTSTTLQTSGTPSTFGATVSFTATVNNGVAPTGSVAFTADSTPICTVGFTGGSVNAPTAVCSTSSLSVGTHSIVATYSGDAGNLGSISPALTQVVNSSGGGSDVIWVEDSVPAGATPLGDEPWNWIGSSPTPFAGALAHQSALTSGEHQHYFSGASATLAVGVGDTLFAYVFLDTANPPSQVMLQWNDGNWEHRAYWGANLIGWGTDGTVSRRFMGALPATGSWVRLAVPASLVGLEGHTLNGMAFTLFGGRATWDHAGKTTSGSSATPTTTTLQTSGTPSTFGATVSFTATVNNGVAPTGSVAFTADSTPICTVGFTGGSVNAPTAVCSTSSLSVGTHSIVATYSGDAGNLGSISPALTQVVNSSGGGSDVIWVEDSVPAGATPLGDEPWNWIGSSPTPFAGALAHQSALTSGEHQHYFSGASATLAVGVGDTLFAYVFLDTANPPSEVMLQWNDGSWEHRAYWGANLIGWGTDGTVSRRFMGALPATGSWVRLAVPASLVGLEGHTLNGMAFTLFGGRATWDHAGKTTSGSSATPTTTTLQTSGTPSTFGATVSFTATVNNGVAPTGSVAFTADSTPICTVGFTGGSVNAPTAVCSTSSLSVGTHSIVATYSGDAGNLGSISPALTQVVNSSGGGSDVIWVEDSVPAGATPLGDEPWNWIGSSPTPFAGALAHQSALTSGEHQHYFSGASATLAVGVGDTLFAYVFLDTANPPSQVMLQWNDGNWEHRAYWGANLIGWGTDGTVSRRFMGALPATGSWVRLAVPASLVGLEGHTLNGMAFTLFDGRATWDHAGKQ